MENSAMPSPEEMQKLLEKAQRELEETLAKMTPEERAAAERRAQTVIDADRAEMQRMTDAAAKLAAGELPEKPAAKFCTNCGAPAEGGKFCTHCGSPL